MKRWNPRKIIKDFHVHPLIPRGRRKDSGRWQLCRRKQVFEYPPKDIFLQGVPSRYIWSLSVVWLTIFFKLGLVGIGRNVIFLVIFYQHGNGRFPTLTGKFRVKVFLN